MNTLSKIATVAFIGLSIGFGATAASASSQRFLDVNINVGGGKGQGGGHGGGHGVQTSGPSREIPRDWWKKRQAHIANEAAAAERFKDAKEKARAEAEAKANANVKPGEKPVKVTTSVMTLGQKQIKACKQQVAIQFVNKSGGVTTSAQAQSKMKQCELMFRD